jgi:hypothetical protein
MNAPIINISMYFEACYAIIYDIDNFYYIHWD